MQHTCVYYLLIINEYTILIHALFIIIYMPAHVTNNNLSRFQ